MTTKELATKFGVKVKSIHNTYRLQGHYRGYEPCHYNGGYHWRFMMDKLFARVPAGTRSRATAADIRAAKARKKIEELKELRRIHKECYGY